MTYFNFNKITPPVGPSDPLVDVNSQLNANWDEIDRTLSVQQGLSPVVNPEIGLEVIDMPNRRFNVYNGSAFISPDDIDNAWTDYIAIPLLAPIFPRLTPRYRSNPLLRRVEVHGQAQNGSLPSAFGTATFQITADTGGIPDSMKPVTQKVIYNNSGGPTTNPSLASASYITVIANPTAGNSVRISGRFMGASNSNSSLFLDGLAWWY
jgi:hypothetical protein